MTFEPVPSHRWPRVLAITASDAPRARAYSTISAFSAYEVVLRPVSAPRSLRVHGTVAIALTSGGRSAGSVTTTCVSPASPRGEPSGPGPGRHRDADATERELLPDHRRRDALAQRAEVGRGRCPDPPPNVTRRSR